MARKNQQPVPTKGFPIGLTLSACLLVGLGAFTAGWSIEDPINHISISLWVPTVFYAIGAALLPLGEVIFTFRQTFSGVGPWIIDALGSDSGCWPTLSLFILIGIVALVVVPVPLTFAHLNRDLYLLFGGFSGVPHGLTYGASIDAWSNYAYSWMWDSITVNFSQIFNLAPTPITPTESWAKWLLFAYCGALDFVVVASVYNLARAMMAKFRKPLQVH